MYKTLLVLLLLLCYTKNVYLFPINHLVSQDCNGLTLQKRAHIYTYIPKKKKKKTERGADAKDEGVMLLEQGEDMF